MWHCSGAEPYFVEFLEEDKRQIEGDEQDEDNSGMLFESLKYFVVHTRHHFACLLLLRNCQGACREQQEVSLLG